MLFYTYIAACRSNTAIYVGVTSDLRKRMREHATGTGSFHTAKYRITKLVYAEAHESLAAAIARERKLKRWRRHWKDALIAKRNPAWQDRSLELSAL